MENIIKSPVIKTALKTYIVAQLAILLLLSMIGIYDVKLENGTSKFEFLILYTFLSACVYGFIDYKDDDQFNPFEAIRYFKKWGVL